ncbi:MAG: aromatic ring-hydroxylating dioxygenase subunit alpha [Pseudomonadota bacterium]
MNLTENLAHIAQQNAGKAEALPFHYYHDPRMLEAEQQHVFSDDWVFCCTEADIPRAGDYLTLTIANEPIAVLRGQDGSLRALSNVCRHRGAVLLTGAGNTDRLRCPFHAWTYADDGQLMAIPFDVDKRVSKEEHCLPSFNIESWLGLVFVSLNPAAPPPAERFGGLEQYYARYQIETFSHASPIEVQHWQANWKVVLANFVEGYHFFAVHENSVEPAAPTRDCFYVDGGKDWSVTGGKQLGDPESLADWLLGKAAESQFLSICMPPNFVCNLYEGYLTWARVLPAGPDSCEVVTGTISAVAFEESRAERAIYEKIFDEDRAICERVQRGVRSSHSRGGVLVDMERAVVDFHQYWAHQLSKPKASGRLQTGL